jgi:hypothetical protein
LPAAVAVPDLVRVAGVAQLRRGRRRRAVVAAARPSINS